jgi:Tat protein translocase TatB subunit
MFDIGFSELLVIGVVALLVLGPERMPRLARDIGRWVGRARRYAARVREEIDREVELTELRRLRDEIESKARAAAAEADEEVASLSASLDDVAQPRPAIPASAGAVAAATNLTTSEEVRTLFRTPYYRVYTSVDLLGCELAGAIKNVIALAVGISIGMGYGENTQAMLITRGLNEVARLCAAHGADPLSAAGLAGMGDLVATCGSPLSRNRTFGELLGKTGSMESALGQWAKTVEGVASSGAIVEIAHRVGIEVPVIESVADIVNGSLSPEAALQRLMEITTKAENFIR